jgi:hypothetical protein
MMSQNCRTSELIYVLEPRGSANLLLRLGLVLAFRGAAPRGHYSRRWFGTLLEGAPSRGLIAPVGDVLATDSPFFGELINGM